MYLFFGSAKSSVAFLKNIRLWLAINSYICKNYYIRYNSYVFPIFEDRSILTNYIIISMLDCTTYAWKIWGK